MRQTLKILVFISFGYALGWAGSVWRFGIPFWGSHRGPPSPETLFDDIGLTADQKVQIQAIREQQKDLMRGNRKELAKARAEFESALDSSQDQRLLREKFKAMSEFKVKFEADHFESMIAIHRLLSPDQIKKLAEKRPKGRHPRRGGGIGRGMFDGYFYDRGGPPRDKEGRPFPGGRRFSPERDGPPPF